MIKTIDPTTFFNIGVVSGFYGLLILMLEFLYIVFAFLVVRQIRLMNRSFKTPAGPVFLLIGRLHLFASLVVFGLSIIAL